MFRCIRNVFCCPNVTFLNVEIKIPLRIYIAHDYVQNKEDSG